MNKNLYLCLDQGGSSSRAIIFDSLGVIVDQQHCGVKEHRVSQAGAGDHVEQQPLELLSSLRASAETVLARLSTEQRGHLVSCGLITQRSSMVCFRRDSGAVLSPVLSWQDTRAADELPTSKTLIADIYERSGLMPNAHFAASKMRWCLKHLTEVQQAREQGQLCFAPLACYLTYQLLDNKPCVVDRGNASRTLLVNVESGDWDDTLLTLFDIKRENLPRLVDSDDSLGDLLVGGLRLPMRLLTGDQCAAAYALGEPNKNAVAINMGTGAFLLTPIGQPSIRNGQLNSIVFWRQGGRYMLEGTVNGAGVAIHAMAKQLAIAKPIECLERLLASDRAPPLWINTYSGLGSPDWRSDLSSVFIDDEASSNELRLLAVAESVVFLLMRNLNAMRAYKPSISCLTVSGGLAGLDGLCQLLADLSALPVERSDSVEASARGAAYWLAGQPKAWPLPSMRVFRPKPKPRLQASYERWSDCLEQKLSD